MQKSSYNTQSSAFTMIELVFVVVILGILAVIALPNLSGSKDVAEKGVLEANIQATQAIIMKLRGDCIIRSAKGSSAVINGISISFAGNCFPSATQTNFDNIVKAANLSSASDATRPIAYHADSSKINAYYYDSNGSITKK